MIRVQRLGRTKNKYDLIKSRVRSFIKLFWMQTMFLELRIQDGQAVKSVIYQDMSPALEREESSSNPGWECHLYSTVKVTKYRQQKK